VLGQHVLAFVAPPHAQACTACLEQVISEPAEVVRVEMLLNPPGENDSGTSVPVEVNVGHFVWQGQPMVQMIVRDITERKRATEQLHSAHHLAEERAARFRQLIEIGRDLLGAPRLQALLDLALERATLFSGYDGGSILLLDDTTGTLEVSASFGVDAVPPGTRVDDLTRSISDKVLATRQTLVLHGQGEEIGTDWRTYTRAISSTICLPLVSASEQAIGVLVLKSTTGTRTLSGDDLDALHLLASQLAIMIERSRLHEENMHLVDKLAERERRLQDLVDKLLVSQEEERRRVAYELHDGLAQVASSAYQHLQTFASRYRSRSERNRQELEHSLTLAQRVVKEARQVIAGLRPTVLDDFGLASALRLEVERLRSEGWDIAYDAAPQVERLPSTVETALFRVAQEALTNIRKHAHTTRAYLALYCREQCMCLEVRDWGCGFHTASVTGDAQAGEHIGLLGMQERMSVLGGKIVIDSQPGNGTRITARVPLSAYGVEGEGAGHG
jgi:signal transduction histidine kinase